MPGHGNSAHPQANERQRYHPNNLVQSGHQTDGKRQGRECQATRRWVRAFQQREAGSWRRPTVVSRHPRAPPTAMNALGWLHPPTSSLQSARPMRPSSWSFREFRRVTPYLQSLDPVALVAPGIPFSSTISLFLAALPVAMLFFLLVARRWEAPMAGLAAVAAAGLIALLVHRMPPEFAALAFLHGVLFGILPIGWTVLAGMLVYNLTVETGAFEKVRESVGRLSPDPRMQALLIGFSFGAFLEGAAGSGTPVAICGAILVGLGFPAFEAAVLCLLANTSPVAFGGLSMPLITLSGVTGLHAPTLSVMAGHQLPFFSVVVPAVMLIRSCVWRDIVSIWPALLVSGISFALCQYCCATAHLWGFGEVYPLTDIAGGMVSLLATALFLTVWTPPPMVHPMRGGHGGPVLNGTRDDALSLSVARAWMPFVFMSGFLMAAGMVRQQEEKSQTAAGAVVAGVPTWIKIPMGPLHLGVQRDEVMRANPDDLEKAIFDFRWATAPGTPVFCAFLLAIPVLGARWSHVRRTFAVTARQMTIPIPTIAIMLGLSYLTKHAGMDAILGHAFASTGALYPLFAAMLGWLGVFLTGTDAGSNALFGSLQKLTALELHRAGQFPGLELEQAQVLICTANSTGGVMGKMIDAQSIVVATAATGQQGREADIFRAVIVPSVVMAALIGLLTLLQAYWAPLQVMVPMPPK